MSLVDPSLSLLDPPYELTGKSLVAVMAEGAENLSLF